MLSLVSKESILVPLVVLVVSAVVAQILKVDLVVVRLAVALLLRQNLPLR